MVIGCPCRVCMEVGEEYHYILSANKNDEGVEIEFDDVKKSNVPHILADGNGESQQGEEGEQTI